MEQGIIKSTGEFIKFAWEEYQVVKRGREYHGCGEEYNIEKRKRGSNIIFPIMLGRISSGEGDGICWG